MSAPRLIRDPALSPLGVIATAMALVLACLGVLAAIGWLASWWRGI